jgi:biotin transport system substrate-specific component
MPSLTPSLALRLGPGAGRLARSAGLVALGTLALAVSARVQVPFHPVPATLQTLVVLLIGAFYGPRLAAATLAAYVGEGLAGLPVFAGAAAGPVYLAGPTGGFLAGFFAMAVVAGWLAARGLTRTLAGALAVALAGHAALYACGLGWLGALIGPDKAIAAGLLPFVLSDAVKIALAAALMTALPRLTPPPAP